MYQVIITTKKTRYIYNVNISLLMMIRYRWLFILQKNEWNL
jgi:hypothetical protein